MSSIINPDFSEMTSPLTAGSHACSIKSFEAKMSKANNPYINWKLETIEGGHTLFYSTPISGKGAGMFKHLVHASGDTAYADGSYDLDHLVGKSILCEVAPESYVNNFGQEKTVMRVKNVSPYDPMTVRAVESDLPF